MPIGETTEATLPADIAGPTPVLVDFWAPWCGPCVALAPHLEKLSERYGERLKVLKLNVDDAPSGGAHFGVRGIPALVLYHRGKEHARLVGPSSMRMHVMMDQWLAELEPDLAGATGDAAMPDTDADRSAASDTVDAPARWHSFRGDDAVKDACLARLKQPADGSYRSASNLLAGDEGSFEDVIGAPAQLGQLIDAAYGAEQPGDMDAMAAQLAELVESARVGVDYGRTASDVLYELVYDSSWALGAKYRQGVASIVFSTIAQHHRNSAAGNEPAPHVWDDLQRQAIELSAQDCPAGMSETLELLARPIREWPPRQVIILLGKEAYSDFGRYSDWSEAESARVDQSEQALLQTITERIGHAPKGPSAERDEWIGQYRTVYSELHSLRVAADPSLWARHEAWRLWSAQTYRQLRHDAAALLRARLAQ